METDEILSAHQAGIGRASSEAGSEENKICMIRNCKSSDVHRKCDDKWILQRAIASLEYSYVVRDINGNVFHPAEGLSKGLTPQARGDFWLGFNESPEHARSSPCALRCRQPTDQGWSDSGFVLRRCCTSRGVQTLVDPDS